MAGELHTFGTSPALSGATPSLASYPTHVFLNNFLELHSKRHMLEAHSWIRSDRCTHRRPCPRPEGGLLPVLQPPFRPTLAFCPCLGLGPFLRSGDKHPLPPQDNVHGCSARRVSQQIQRCSGVSRTPPPGTSPGFPWSLPLLSPGVPGPSAPYGSSPGFWGSLLCPHSPMPRFS